MSKNGKQSMLVPDEGNGDQPSFADLQKAARIIDDNVNEERQRDLKLAAMADHGLVDPDAGNAAKTSKKDQNAIDAANKRAAEAEAEVAAMRAQLAATAANTPAPAVPPTVAAATAATGDTPPNPFAAP